MTTALTVYSTTVASTTLSTANQFATATGGTSATKDTKIGTATGWSELYAQGTTNAWSGAGSIGSPSGNGWLLDATTLEGQQIVAGNWTPTVRLQIAGGGTPSITADIYVRAYVRHSDGTYTQIGSNMTKTGQTLNSTATNYAFSATNQALQSFATGDKLYIDLWLNVTATSGASSANNVRVSESSTSGQGIANNMSIVTPGYQPITNNAMSSEDDLTITESVLFLGDTTPGMVESNTASDLTSALFQWGIDTLSISDSASFVTNNVPIDALLASESVSYVGGAGLEDDLVCIDIGGLQAWGIDALSASDFSNWFTWSIDGLTADDSATQFTALETRTEALTLTEIYLPVVRFTPGDMKNLVVSDARIFAEVFIPVDSTPASDSFSSVNANVMSFEEDLVVLSSVLGSDVAIPVDILPLTEYVLQYSFLNDQSSLILSVAQSVLHTMWTHAWNPQAATKRHDQTYAITGGMFINWQHDIDFSDYDQFLDINLAETDSNIPAQGLTSINLHDVQVCLQYVRTMSWYKKTAPSDASFDNNNSLGYMGVSAMVNHLLVDFAPRYTASVFGGYNNPKGWVYFALLDIFLNLKSSPLLTAAQVNSIQQSLLYQAWTYYNNWYDSTAQILGQINNHTYQPPQSLLMSAALIDAVQRFPTQIVTGMFYSATNVVQSPTLWQNAALANVNSMLTRGSLSTTYNLFYGTMNIKDGLPTDTVRTVQCKLGDTAEAAQALIRLYNLTGTSSYLSQANTILQALEKTFWDNQYGGYYFALNLDGSGFANTYKECRASAHMLIAYHMYNNINPIYRDRENAITYIMCNKMYKSYGEGGFWYRALSNIDFSVFIDNYAPAFSSELTTDANAGDTSIQILSAVGLGKTGSIDLIIDAYGPTEEELAFKLPATLIGGGNTDLASDTFAGRTVVGGWGTSDDDAGDVWTKLVGSGTLSVNNDTGQLASPSSTTVMQLGSLTFDDSDTSVRISLGSTADRPGILARINGSNTYYEFFVGGTNLIKITRVVSGVGTTIASGAFTITAGTFYWLRFQVAGSAFAGKIWADGTAEPSTFNISGNDSGIATGGIGLIGVATTTTADTYDSYQVNPPPPYLLNVNPLSNNGTGALSKSHTSGTAIQSLDFPVDNIEDEYTTEAMTGTTVYMLMAIILNNLMSSEDDLATKDMTAALFSWPVENLMVSEALLAVESSIATESLAANENMLTMESQARTEALVASESMLTVASQSQLEALAISESISFILTIIPLEALTASDIGALQQWLMESLAISDIGGLQSWTFDSLSASDSASYTTSAVPVEMLPLQEALLIIDSLMKQDALIITDVGYLSSGATTFVFIMATFRDGTHVVMSRNGIQEVQVR